MRARGSTRWWHLRPAPELGPVLPRRGSGGGGDEGLRHAPDGDPRGHPRRRAVRPDADFRDALLQRVRAHQEARGGQRLPTVAHRHPCLCRLHRHARRSFLCSPDIDVCQGAHEGRLGRSEAGQGDLLQAVPIFAQGRGRGIVYGLGDGPWSTVANRRAGRLIIALVRARCRGGQKRPLVQELLLGRHVHGVDLLVEHFVHSLGAFTAQPLVKGDLLALYQLLDCEGMGVRVSVCWGRTYLLDHARIGEKRNSSLFHHLPPVLWKMHWLIKTAGRPTDNSKDRKPPWSMAR